MSISDLIVVMKDGVVQQIGKPQEVYDAPENLFVAKFLGTPPINVFRGQLRDGQLFIGNEAVLRVNAQREGSVTVAIRPEGFIPTREGSFHCALSAIEVMGRDISVVCTHPESENAAIRAIVSAEHTAILEGTAAFCLKPHKVFLFDPENGQRIPFTVE